MSAPADTRVGLVGAGYVSAYHIRALQTLPRVRIVGIADPAIARARSLAERFRIPGVFASLADLRHARPDVVHILTPPASHAPLAIEALEMGCHVFVEKPMAPTVADCDAMIAASVRTGRTLSVNHSAVDDPVVVRALDMVRRGVCGNIVGVDFCRSSDYPPYPGGVLPAMFRQGGYPFQDLGVHALYLMEAFLGAIRDVDVRFRSTGNDPNVFFDDWRGTVTCARGTGAFYLSWSVRPIRNEIFVHGTRADLHVDCFLQTCSVRRPLPGPKPVTAGVNAIAHAVRTFWHVPKNVARFVGGSLQPSPGIHDGVLRFHEALARGARPPVSAEAARRIVSWLEPACRDADARRDRELRMNEQLAPRKVLVTGASGLLGRALVDRLRERGQSIRVLVRRRAPELEGLSDVQVVYGDLGDPDAVDRAVAGVRLVYHVGAAMRARSWPEFEGSTVRGTANVVRSCEEHHVERLVHVSSLAVLDYARHASHTVVSEDAPLEPKAEQRGSYTRAKLMAEQIVLDAHRSGRLQAVVLRPGQITGPGYESVPPYGTIAVAGRWIVIGLGSLRLPLVHVNDVVDGLLAAATQPDVCGSVFHLVDSTPVTQRRYIDDCRRKTNGAIRVVYVPRPLLLAAGVAFETVGRLIGRHLPLTGYRVRSVNDLSFDCSAARQRLGWVPVAPGSRQSSAVLLGAFVSSRPT
ncbi:MAG TPA: NAD-dependent epimerase/dehydratase family protein [Vicinamibacterales bacterium]